MARKNGWYTTVSSGGGLVTAYRCDWPRGPWRSKEEATAALNRWRERKGALAGTIEAAHNVQIVGPFPTREIARSVDISDYHRHLSV